METAPVSVVIPYFEGGDTIRRAVDSLERQTVRPREIVIVDDGSRGTPYEAGMASGTIPVRTVRHPENRGIPAARNAGIRVASSPWLAFLDQDDDWSPRKLERQWRVVVADSSPDDLVVFGRLLVEAGNGRSHLHPPRRAIEAAEAGGLALVKAFLRYGNVLPLVTLLVPRSVLDRHGPFDESLRGGADDTELVLRLIGEGVRFRFDGASDGEWSVAHRHTGSNYSDHAPRWVRDQLEFVPRLAGRYPLIQEHESAFVARSYFTLGRHHEREGSGLEAARAYRRAIRHQPGWWRPWVAEVRLLAPAAVRRTTGRAWDALKHALREAPDAGQG